MGNSIFLILFAIACSVAGQLTLKIGMNGVGQVSAASLAQPIQLVGRVAGNPYVIGGLGLYAIGAMAWLAVLSRIPLSIAYPNVALTYAVTPVLAWLVLGESVSSGRWLGIVIICLGVIVVSRG